MCQINQILETSSAKIFDFVHIFPEDRQKSNSDERQNIKCHV